MRRKGAPLDNLSEGTPRGGTPDAPLDSITFDRTAKGVILLNDFLKQN